jgi:hypothetical protein
MEAIETINKKTGATRACFQSPEDQLDVGGCTNALTAVPHWFDIEVKRGENLSD